MVSAHSLMVKFFIALSLLLLGSCLMASMARADDYLAPEVAFKFAAKRLDAKTIEVNYAIADGYYMYRDRVHFRADGVTLGEPVFPQGKVKFDENFQKDVETYRQNVRISVPVDTAASFKLTVTAQGCADQGLCYPPMDSVLVIPAASAEPSVGISTSQAQAPDSALPSSSANASEQDDMGRIASVLKSGKILTIVSLFFLLGLGLSFTPCVLPMVPILSSIIVGEGTQVKRARAFLLAVMYALGMALVYTVMGVAAGLLGEGLSAKLQNPWVLSSFGLLMVLLSLAMFDVYQLQVPSALQSKLTRASENQGGKLLGVFLMGAISALIVGPCVAAPLAGALVYISQTRDVVLGGSALFAMAVGMSVPLMLIGASAGTLLPRAGAWMASVKRCFGVLMLATALWMVSPVLPAWLFVAGWAALGIGYGGYLLWSKSGHWVARSLGLVVTVLGLLQLVNVATGGRDALAPMSHLRAGQAQVHTDFVRVRNSAELEAALAQTNGKPALLDFYADWCVSCKEMEKFTFTDARVRDKFSQLVLLQIDVTANNADDKAMLKRFGLFGPPGIILFDRQGSEVVGKRVIGYQNAEQFLQSLQAVLP